MFELSNYVENYINFHNVIYDHVDNINEEEYRNFDISWPSLGTYIISLSSELPVTQPGDTGSHESH